MARAVRSRIVLLLAIASLASAAGAADIRPLIANGFEGPDWPEVGILLSTTGGSCSVTAIGCRHVLTAAHCVCSELGTGPACAAGEFFVDPGTLEVVLPQAGLFYVEQIVIPPNYAFGVRGDLAVLRLTRPLRSVAPRPINEQARPPAGTSATVVGYGTTADAAQDGGLKRFGFVTTASCPSGIPSSTHVCWNHPNPPGSTANICPGDSGGALLVDFGAGPVLAGVHSGGDLDGCDPPSFAFDTDVYVQRAFIRSIVGADLDEPACGGGAQVGDAGVATHFFTGTASATQTFHQVAIPAGVKQMRVSLAGRAAGSAHLDLYVRLGAPPTTSAFDCSSAFEGTSQEYCAIVDPTPGTAHVMVRRTGGTTNYQVTVTLLPEDPEPPPLGPAGGAVVANFASYELLQVDAASGRRSTVSSDLRGQGPPLVNPEDVALDPIDGSLLVANAYGPNLLRVNRASGDRSVVSGCLDAACSATRGTGPPLLGPRFVARAHDGAWLVADRGPQPGHWAIVRVDPASGDRTVVSGCVNAACSSQVGVGPTIGRLFGMALEPAGSLVVADGQAVYRIELSTGNRWVLSGCNGSCVGCGELFGEPVDVVVEPDGSILVSYRVEGGTFGAIRRIDRVSGDRTLVSGCQNQACTSVRGSGPRFVDLFGLAREPGGTLLASDSRLHALMRVDPVTGDRTLVSGCGDENCTTSAGTGAGFGEPVGLEFVPAPDPRAGALAACAALALLARRARARGRCPAVG